MRIFGDGPKILSTRPRGEVESLPLELDISTSLLHALPRVLGGALLLAIALVAYQGFTSQGEFGPVIKMAFQAAPVILALAGLFVLVQGAIGLVDKRTVRIDGDTVEVSGRSLLKSENWSEPLSAFEGVRWREFVVQRRLAVNSSNRTSRLPKVYQALDLLHPDPAKCVPLYVTRLRDVTRPKWEKLAKLLGAPAIDARGGERRVRAAEDLDKPVRRLAQEGKIHAEWDRSAPPAGLEVAKEGDGPDAERIVATIHAKRYPTWLYGGVMAFAALFLILGVTDLAFMPALFGGALGAGVAWHWRSEDHNPRTICITRAAVEIHTPNPGNAPTHDVLDHSTIRDVHIGKSYDKSSIGPHLLISTKSGEIKVGSGLSREGLDWLRDLILAAIAKA